MSLSLNELTDLAHHANVQIADICERVVGLCDEPSERYTVSLLAMMSSHKAFSAVMRLDTDTMRGPFAGLSERDSWLAVITTMQLVADMPAGQTPDDPTHFVNCILKLQKMLKGVRITAEA